MSNQIQTIIIPSGGEGARIAPYFSRLGFLLPKPLFPILEIPVLQRIIDMAIELGFERIIIMAGVGGMAVDLFVKNHYGNNKITVVHDTPDGTKIGVPAALYSIRETLNHPFVYSDGNLVYDKSILKSMQNISSLKDTLVNLAVSTYDAAKTHSGVCIECENVTAIHARVPGSIHNADHIQGQSHLVSLGLMSIDNKIFDYVPDMFTYNDFDLVVEKLFDVHDGAHYVRHTLYDGYWAAIHDEYDIDTAIKALETFEVQDATHTGHSPISGLATAERS